MEVPSNNELKITSANEKKSEAPENLNPNSGKKNHHRKSSALRAAGQWRSAVDHVRAHSHNDIEGSSRLANTGPYIDYDEK